MKEKKITFLDELELFIEEKLTLSKFKLKFRITERSTDWLTSTTISVG
jgi:hypothetical protein